MRKIVPTGMGVSFLAVLSIGATQACSTGATSTPTDTGEAGTTPSTCGADPGTLDAAAADEGVTDAARATVAITDLATWSNCMPTLQTGADPIRASWTATVSGAGGTAATLTRAILIVDSSPPIVQPITVDAPTIPLSGGRGSQKQIKLTAACNPAKPCEAECKAFSAHVVVTFLMDGLFVDASADSSFDCSI